jgi:predicted transcriptional regulator YdeE
METKIVELPEFSVVGIQARTNNAKEMKGEGEIPKQWARFFKEKIANQIPNKVDSNIYAVYTAYASDHNGDYDFVIGTKVSDVSDVLPGMVAVKVPKGRYAIVTSAKGPVAQVVPQAWHQVYDLEGGHRLKRAYKADLEIYDERSQDPQNSQVDLYIGIE